MGMPQISNDWLLRVIEGETVDERRARIFREATVVETEAEKGLWWLWFTDPDIAATIPHDQQRPGGASFLGVCIVEAATLPGAVVAAHAAGCNPGGQVGSRGPMPMDTWAPEWRNRLLTYDEALPVWGPGP